VADAIRSKVGIIACSGEEIAQGTITRLALLKVMEELRPGLTTSLCLPLFLAGDEGHRGFARRHPTIAVDGCALRCAARATAEHSAEPVASLVVDDVIAEMGLPPPQGCRRLDAAGREAVDEVARRIAVLVDTAMDRRPSVPAGDGAKSSSAPTGEAVCSCGSGVSVTRLDILGKTVEVVALPLLLRQFREAGRPPDEATARDLFEQVKVYNAVPPVAEDAWREAILHEYEREVSR